MICQDCKNGYHEGCRGKTWCPCQHRGHQCSRECNHEAEEIYSQIMGGPVIEAKVMGLPFVLQVPEGKTVDEFRREVEAAMELTQLAQEMGLE